MAKNLLSSGIVLAVLTLAGFWLWRAVLSGDPMQMLAVLTGVLAAVAGVVWQSHARHVRRWRTALDAYAERSLTRETGRPVLVRPRRQVSAHNNRGG
jgi:hypothetical protein